MVGGKRVKTNGWAGRESGRGCANPWLPFLRVGCQQEGISSLVLHAAHARECRLSHVPLQPAPGEPGELEGELLALRGTQVVALQSLQGRKQQRSRAVRCAGEQGHHRCFFL